MLSYNITGFKICVLLSQSQWERLMALHADDGPLTVNGYQFIKNLEAVGAEEVTWARLPGDHPGRYLFFNARADFDTDEYGRSVVERVVTKIEELLA